LICNLPLPTFTLSLSLLQLLLSLARGLFSEQRSLERLIFKIILQAKDLLKVERCTVYLLERKMYDLVSAAAGDRRV
jgi:hypothetical protein